MNTMFDLPWDHPVKAEAKRSRKVATCALFSRAMVDSLPEGWKVRVARAWSPLHDDVLWTMWLDEPVMGWSEWHSSTDLSDLVDWANGYVDECMASCVPDQGNGIPTPSKCDVTQGGDKLRCECGTALITLSEDNDALVIGCPRCCTTMGTHQWCRACLQPKDNDDDLCPACWAGGLR